MPWGAEVEYAYRAGYDSRGRVSVTHLVDERGCSAMLTKPELDGAGPGEDRTSPKHGYSYNGNGHNADSLPLT